MQEALIFLLLFLPVILVTSYVYLAKRRYERAHIQKRVKYHLRKK